LQEAIVFWRMLLAMFLTVAAIPVAHPAGEAAGCPADSEAVAAAAAAVTDGTFTRPEAGVPAAKRTACGLYATAQDAYDMVREAPDKVLFIDVRTPAELQFIGMPTLIDANVPVLLESSPPQWDDVNSTFKLAPNPKFVEGVDARLARKGLTRNDQVILICQGGVRAARAANLLMQAGYAKVYTTIDGFEGDPAPDGPHKGERIVNGWRNAGLPWTARLDRSKMYGLQ
jgi:rhodanese-related sulfurtransferase